MAIEKDTALQLQCASRTRSDADPFVWCGRLCLRGRSMNGLHGTSWPHLATRPAERPWGVGPGSRKILLTEMNLPPVLRKCLVQRWIKWFVFFLLGLLQVFASKGVYGAGIMGITQNRDRTPRRRGAPLASGRESESPCT